MSLSFSADAASIAARSAPARLGALASVRRRCRQRPIADGSRARAHHDRQRQRHVHILGHTNVLADQGRRHAAFSVAISSPAQRVRQHAVSSTRASSSLAGVAVVHQGGGRQRLQRRPDDRAGAPAGWQRPRQRRRFAGSRLDSSVGVPAVVDRLADGGLAGRDRSSSVLAADVLVVARDHVYHFRRCLSAAPKARARGPTRRRCFTRLAWAWAPDPHGRERAGVRLRAEPRSALPSFASVIRSQSGR